MITLVSFQLSLKTALNACFAIIFLSLATQLMTSPEGYIFYWFLEGHSIMRFSFHGLEICNAIATFS